MNKIQVEDIINEEKNIQVEKDTNIFINNSNTTINIIPKQNTNIFILITSSDIKLNINTNYNLNLNIFSVDTSLTSNINLNKKYIELNYTYSTINNIDNKYKTKINHLANNIKSNIVSHGINLSNKLFFEVNAIIPKTSIGVITNQDSKIILEDGEALIKPNLLVDIDNIKANHAAYIGSFKEQELFYLKTRGLDENTCKKLLAKSFILGKMNITFREINIILNILKKYWR